MGRAFRFLLQRLDDDGFNLVVADLAGSATSGLIVEAIKPMLGGALAPGAHRLARDARRVRNLTVVHPFGRAQNDLSPHGIALRDLAAPDAALKKDPFALSVTALALVALRTIMPASESSVTATESQLHQHG